MQVKTVRRAAIDRWLRMARLPFDTVAHLLPENPGPRDAASLVIDRADATVRAAVGGLLNDEELRDDGLRRRAAADERERAIELRGVAQEKKLVADQELAQELDGAARLREEAEIEAEKRLRRTDEERAARERQVRDAAAAQERVVEQARAERLAATEKKAKRERLDVLEEEAGALDHEADALTAADEAQRLRDAASAAKATRKGTA